MSRNTKNEVRWKERHYFRSRISSLNFRHVISALLWWRRRGRGRACRAREPKTWLKILRCGRKWISDTRNATLFGTITRESPSKPPISIQPLLEIYLLDQKVLTCDLAPTNAVPGGMQTRSRERISVILFIFPQIIHTNSARTRCTHINANAHV